MEKEWLIEKVSKEDVEKEYQEIFNEFKIDITQPHIIKAIEKINTFLSKMEEGDELWRFHSGRSSFVSLSGRAGYSIVRNGEIIENHITRVS